MTDKKITVRDHCLIFDDHDLFVVTGRGVRIAKRGHPGSVNARRWITLEFGYDDVQDEFNNSELVIGFDGGDVRRIGERRTTH
jgi:hypothetical protein